MVWRDTRAAGLDAAQRLTHFPASPLVALSFFHGLDVGLVRPGPVGQRWHPFGAAVVWSGSQSQPRVTWAPGTGFGGMVCFEADVARALFGLDLATVHDRFVCAQEVSAPAHWPLYDALARAADPAHMMRALEQHLALRWGGLQGRPPGAGPALRHVGRHWVQRLALQAREGLRTHSPRQVERRIRASSGRSLREWQSLVRTEGAFFAARERHEAGLPLAWADLAAEQGFADQAHLTRMTRRITGFSPTEFTQRFLEDESFWLYRLWV